MIVSFILRLDCFLSDFCAIPIVLELICNILKMKSITLHKSQGCHEKLKDLLFFYFNKWLNSLIKERKDRTINKINLYINSLLMSAINMLFWVPQSIEICLPWFHGLMDQTKRKPCHPWCNIQDLTHLYLVYWPVTILTNLTKTCHISRMHISIDSTISIQQLRMPNSMVTF